MKRFMYLAAILFAAATLSVNAQESNEGPTRLSAENIAERESKRMEQELSLTQAQYEQVYGINLEYAEKQMAEMEARRQEQGERRQEANSNRRNNNNSNSNRSNNRPGGERMAPAMRLSAELTAERNTKFESVLSKEQLAKWKEVSERRPERPQGQRGQGGPQRRGNDGGFGDDGFDF